MDDYKTCYFKAVNRSAKVTGVDASDIHRYFNKFNEAPYGKIRRALTLSYEILNKYKKKNGIGEEETHLQPI